MFLYLITMIPCDWIAKAQVLDCVASSSDADNSACLRAVNDSAAIYQVRKLVFLLLTQYASKTDHYRHTLKRLVNTGLIEHKTH